MACEGDLSECAACLCLASRRAARGITRLFERHLRPHGIRATQFSVLVILQLSGPQTIGELAESLGADPTTLSRNLALLETRALVKIRPGEDARARIAAITAKGKTALMRALPAWRDAQAALSQSIGGQAADSLRRLARSPLA